MSQDKSYRNEWNFHSGLFSSRGSFGQSLKSKIEDWFFQCPEGDHRFLLKSSVKAPYLKNRASGNRTILDFWITHYTWLNEPSDNQKTILHLERFPREWRLIFELICSIVRVIWINSRLFIVKRIGVSVLFESTWCPSHSLSPGSCQQWTREGFLLREANGSYHLLLLPIFFLSVQRRSKFYFRTHRRC